MVCPNCGNILASGDLFCGQCGGENQQNALTIAAPICPNCHNQLRLNARFCGRCGKATDIGINLTTVAASDSTMIVSPGITPPLHIAAPTEMQLREAKTSLKNPYAPWGRQPFLNDEMKRIWTENEACKYIQEGFRIQVRDFSRPEETIYYPTRAILPQRSVSDFVMQTEIKINNGYDNANQAGIIFHADRNAETYYRYSISGLFDEYRACELLTETGETIGYWPNNPAIMDGRYNLLAVVVQNGVFDLYVNLHHIDQVKDTRLSSGFLGVIVSGIDLGFAFFRNTRVWVNS